MEGVNRARQATSGLPQANLMMARYYSSSLGRFMAVDPGDNQALEHPQSWNRYVYVGNNPIGKIDPDGRCEANASGDVPVADPGQQAMEMPGNAVASFLHDVSTVTAAFGPGPKPSLTDFAIAAVSLVVAFAAGPEGEGEAAGIRSAEGAGERAASRSGMNPATQAAKDANIDVGSLDRSVAHERPSTEGGTSTVHKYTDTKTGQTNLVTHTVTDAEGKVIHRDVKAVRDRQGNLHKFNEPKTPQKK